MKIAARTNYSTLFNTMSGYDSSNDISGLSNLISDYASIKNGSYRKVVSAYYTKVGGNQNTSSEVDSDSASVSSSTDKAKEFTNVAKKSDQLEKSVESLNDSKIYSDDQKESLYSKVSSFVNDYNSLLSESSTSSSNTVVNRSKFMTSLSEKNANDLANIGISVSDSGRLSLDTDVLKQAAVSDIKDLMSGKSSYAAGIASASSLIGSAAESAASSTGTYTSTGATSKINYSSMFEAFS